ncbi:MAG: hypothetical protein R2778_02310 [Saprospiraceae bacterium]
MSRPELPKRFSGMCRNYISLWRSWSKVKGVIPIVAVNTRIIRKPDISVVVFKISLDFGSCV